MSANAPNREYKNQSSSNRPPRPAHGSAAASTSTRPYPPRPSNNGGATRDKPRPKSAKPAKLPNDHLSLANMVLTAPPDLTRLAATLHKLDLTNCGLTKLAFVQQVAGTLTWLNVSGNNLSGPEAWDGVETLSRLFVLNASHCELTEAPVVIESLHSLKALVLSHNSLSSLEHVRRLTNLNTIVVSHNRLTSLPAELATLPSLKKLSAAHNLLTASTLPDLSLLSLLSELRLNDNPTLTALPDHFGGWGKGSLGDLEFKGKKRRSGLEVVDLGNCGFVDWMQLRSLAKQSGIINLGLKGTVVATEAMEDGFDEFKRKITILLPALRILDGNRFDAKFLDLREKRAARDPEQFRKESGPMAMIGYEKNKKEVPEEEEVDTAVVVKKDKGKKRARDEEADGEKKSKKERKAKGVEDALEVEEVAPALVKERRAKEVVETGGEDSKTDDTVPKKKRKNGHAARREAEAEAKGIPAISKSSSSTADPPAPVESAATVETPLVRKRGRHSKQVLVAPPPRTAESTTPKPKIKKDPRGALSALLGTPEEQAAAKAAASSRFSTGANATAPEPAAPKVDDNAKTSVLKIVEVKRNKDGKKGKEAASGSLDSLLALLGGGAATSADNEAVGAIGLGGWD